jgi:hypothetical protein
MTRSSARLPTSTSGSTGAGTPVRTHSEPAMPRIVRVRNTAHLVLLCASGTTVPGRVRRSCPRRWIAPPPRRERTRRCRRARRVRGGGDIEERGTAPPRQKDPQMPAVSSSRESTQVTAPPATFFLRAGARCCLFVRNQPPRISGAVRASSDCAHHRDPVRQRAESGRPWRCARRSDTRPRTADSGRSGHADPMGDRIPRRRRRTGVSHPTEADATVCGSRCCVPRPTSTGRTSP